ncbi:hypothetical protein AB0D94_31235 [Streptomyces sp. NPDC048255]|uniref:hypothetical protein n=1 Tax=Streptomyces sp. NPDC048255 TaxID=3154713 RepID=UPI0033EC38C6
MNDPISLAATEDEDRQGTPDTTAPESAGTEPVHTLLRTAATCRPLEEVTELVSLLRETGQLPNPGHEALRTAAVTRPVHEVRRMVALLGEPPHEVDEADITLRAAAVGRPIEDVALLVSILSGADGPAEQDGRHPAEVAPPTARAGGELPGKPHQKQYEEQDEEPYVEPYDEMYEEPYEPPYKELYDAPYAQRPRLAARVGEAPAPAPAGSSGSGSAALRHVLRWPVALALLVSGALHLPQDLTVPPSAAPAELLPLLATVLCLGFGALLALWDTTTVWRAAAATAVGVVALHVLGGTVDFDPLGGAMGASVAWAGVVAVLCAAAAAVLAGMALRTRAEARTRPGEAA